MSNSFYLPPILENSLGHRTPTCKDHMDSPKTPSNYNSTRNNLPASDTPIPFEVNTPSGILANRDNEVTSPNLNLSNNSLFPESPQHLKDDINLLSNLISKYPKNPSIGYLNINSLRGNKILQLQNIFEREKIGILCIDETKLSEEIPTSRLHIHGYQYPPHRRDRPQKTTNSFGGGKLVYIREGFISKRLTSLETQTAETICIELTLKSKKWFIMFAYRPESINRNLFFEEITLSLSKALNKYENIILIGDLNIDISIPNNDISNLLGNLCDVFDLSNMIKNNTCFMSQKGTSIDVMLTNKPTSFFKTSTIETGLSDHHKLVISFLKSQNSFKLKPKNIVYRETKKIDLERFKQDISNLPISELQRFPDPLTGFVTLFKSIVDRHAPIKTKKIRGNNKPFMNSDLNNAIKQKSKIRNIYNKWKSRENYLAWQNIKYKCKRLANKAEKDHFERIVSKGIMSNQEFWKKVKPALSETNPTNNTDIILEENGILVANNIEISEIFNNQYINIVKSETGFAPETLGDVDILDKISISNYIDKVIYHYDEHPSIIKINQNFTNLHPFKIPFANLDDVNLILKNLDTRKAPGPDLLPPKLIKIVKDIINLPLTDVINHIIKSCIFPENGKIAHVTPVFKTDKKDRQNKSNYRPISVLGVFSKIVERFIEIKTNEHIETVLSVFIAAYRKKYSTNHVLIRLIESWKLQLDNKKFVGAVLMDLSKAFDCVPHDLLIAKMHAYGFDRDTLILMFSYLKGRKQGVKVNNEIHSFMTLVSGVPQGSILGPILFNLFINDITYYFKESNLFNYADDNTLSAFADTIHELIQTLQSESEIAIKWFNDNKMFVNPNKFQAIIIDKENKGELNSHNLKFGDYKIKSRKNVTLLGIDIDDRLKFDNHTHSLIRKASGQLNYLISKQKFLNKNAKKILIESFIMANFNYCPLVWLFCDKKLTTKQEQIQKRALRFLHDDYESDYDHLLKMSNKPSIEIKKLRILATEVFKTLNDLNPSFMKEVFTQNSIRDDTRLKLLVKTQRTKRYGTDSLRSLGPKIWNNLPTEIRGAENLSTFKRLINTWSGAECACRVCSAST